MKKKHLIISVTLILVALLIYYYFLSASTASFGKIERKVSIDNHFYIEVKFEDGTLRNISVPSIVWPFLEEEKTYFMDYRFNLLRKPYLVKIKMEDNS
ncbi:hypothetical protein [Paenibacillus sp. NPDC101420]|uniref:hypothetical protein n=1 Tax=Paenibacillus sp. NPDC101420 TaxID=3390602 RepID=UPI003CFBC73E